jgi:cytochrome b subunit of formate dehydrogenase
MNNSRYYTRFTLGERFMHGILTLTFLGLAMTGLPLRFNQRVWSIAFARGVGGFGTIIFFHEACAVVLTLMFLAHVSNIGYRVAFKKEYSLIWGPTSMVPRWKDVTDLLGHIRWFLFLGPKPKFDRYSYWEKVDYWAVFWGMTIIGLSGYAMWFAPFFARFIPGSLLNVALLIHSEEALMAVGFIFSIHFFNTHIRPYNFPMDLTVFTGKETEEELKERHPDEYDRLVHTGELEKLETSPPPRWENNFSRVMGVVAVALGLVMVGLTAIAFVKE